MRLLLFTFFIFNFLIASDDITVLDSEKKLLERFNQFWNYRSNRDFDNMYKMESPHQQFLYTLESYKNFFAAIPSGSKVKIKKLEKIENDIYNIHANLCLNGDSDCPYLVYKWIEIDGDWYDVFNENTFPILE